MDEKDEYIEVVTEEEIYNMVLNKGWYEIIRDPRRENKQDLYDLALSIESSMKFLANLKTCDLKVVQCRKYYVLLAKPVKADDSRFGKLE